VPLDFSQRRSGRRTWNRYRLSGGVEATVSYAVRPYLPCAAGIESLSIAESVECPEGSALPMPRYNPAQIEPKWQNYWESHRTFRSPDLPPAAATAKRYVLDMFPYPSGDGLHVGHPEGYTATDIVCRFARMNGESVLHPMASIRSGFRRRSTRLRPIPPLGSRPKRTSPRSVGS